MTETDADLDPRYSSPLHGAAANGELELIAELARDPEALNRLGAFDMTPLMTALVYHQHEAAMRLLDLGADVSKPSSVGSTPLLSACLAGSLALVERLLALGAEVNLQQVSHGKPHMTALILATEVGDASIVRRLLESGADPSPRNGHGESALEIALRKGRADLVSLLASAATRHGEAMGWGKAREEDPTGDLLDFNAQTARELEARVSRLPPEQRREKLVDGIMNGGQAFMNTIARLAEVSDEGSMWHGELHAARVLWTTWLMGTRLTDRADEAERRLSAVEDVIARAGPGVVNIITAHARAILALPKGHPRRNVEFALNTLASYVEHCAAHESPGDLVLAFFELLESSYEASDALDVERFAALVQSAEQAVSAMENDPGINVSMESAGMGRPESGGVVPIEDVRRIYMQHLLSLASGSLLLRAHHAQKTSDLPTKQTAILRCREYLTRCAEYATPEDLGSLESKHAALEELDDRLEAAAAMYERASSRGTTAALTSRTSAGRLRLRLGDPVRAAELLGPAIAPLRATYLEALDPAEIASSGESFASVATMYALALARSGRWDEALQALDGGKSLRLRQRSRLRRSELGQHALAVEAALYNLHRGLEPPVSSRASGISLDLEHNGVLRRSLFLEEYRRLGSLFSENCVDSPRVRELAAVLSAEEGVVIIGTSWAGTMLALVTHRDGDEPCAVRVLPELSRNELFASCGDWRSVLIAPEGHKPRSYAASLASLLPNLDAVLGEPIRALIGTRPLSKLTIVPHLWLHAAPFWALPSLAGFDVALAHSAGQVVASRACTALGRVAAVVGDPTLDLPLSRVESRSVEHALSRAGVHVARVEGQAANEKQVVDAVSGAALFHYAGHGRADALTPSRSALLLQPERQVPGLDPIVDAYRSVEGWDHSPQEGRFANLKDGRRLYELRFADEAREYFLEQGDRETLWARYVGNNQVLFAELWRAGELSAQRELDDCSIVFLSACEVGSGGLGSIYDREIDECGGITGALELAGVACVVASLWPVWEDLALVYVALFYAELARATARFDVASIICRVGRQVRDLTGEQAAAIVHAQGTLTHDRMLRFRLDAVGRRLAKLPRPFEDPIHWAAFFVTGAREFAWRT